MSSAPDDTTGTDFDFVTTPDGQPTDSSFESRVRVGDHELHPA